MIWGLLLCAASARAATPEASIDNIFQRIEAVEHQQFDQPADTNRALDKKIEALTPQVLRLGHTAIPELAKIAQDPKRSDKTRLWAVTFLGLTHDPAALAPLEAVLDDPKAPESSRAEAASAIPGIDVNPPTQRGILCESLALELPRSALRETLYALSHLGCEDMKELELRSKQFGGKPDAADARLVAYAVQAIGRSFPVEAARALWRLFDFFPKDSPSRLEILKQLLVQADNQRIVGPITLTNAKAALLAESDAPANAIAAAHLLDSFNEPRTAPLFARFLKNKDAEVATVCAESLAHLRDKASAKALHDMLEHITDDPRFAPSPNKPDPVELVARIQKASDSLAKLP